MRRPSSTLFGAALALSIGAVGVFLVTRPPDAPKSINLTAAWAMHVITPGAAGSGSAHGADGIAIADVDGDGLPDVLSGMEQGLQSVVAFHPGYESVREVSEWPDRLELPAVPPQAHGCSVEDAVFGDINEDGALDVAVACETGTVRVSLFLAPAPPNTRAELLVGTNWTRVDLTASANRRSMRLQIIDVAGDSSPEIVVGEKDAGVASTLGYYSSETPADGASWTHTTIVPAGWVMDMYVFDLDSDGDLDILYSDKTATVVPADGTRRGLRWLDNDGDLDPPVYVERAITAVEGAWKWFDVVDWDGDGDPDVVACRSEAPSLHEQAIYLNGGGGLSWTELPIDIPTGVGLCQETTAVDLDQDGKRDIAVSYSNSTNLSGVAWSKQSGTSLAPELARGEIAGILDADSDTKFDNLEWVDMDGDGDLDAVLSEQHVPSGTGPGLGVIWFENPLIAPPALLAVADAGMPDASLPDAAVPDAAPGGGGTITCTALTSGTDTVASTTAVSAEVTPGANRVVYAAYLTALGGSGPDAPTGVSGNGLTWVQEETQQFHTNNTRRITVFRAMGDTPSAGAVTATWAVNQTSKQWSIIECDGVDTSGTNGSGATVQSVGSAVTGATTMTNTLAALAATSSVHLAWTGITNGNTTITPDADFAELTDTTVATGVGTFESEWATDQAPVTPTWAASGNAGTISIEVRAAP